MSWSNKMWEEKFRRDAIIAKALENMNALQRLDVMNRLEELNKQFESGCYSKSIDSEYNDLVDKLSELTMGMVTTRKEAKKCWTTSELLRKL